MASRSRPITVVIGTRAQLIKMAPVIRQLEVRGHCLKLVFTGQHTVTMRELLSDFGVRACPEQIYNGGEVSGLLGMAVWIPLVVVRLVRRRRRLFQQADGVRSLVIVHGDTFSTLVGALAGRMAGCPVAHVESGLRSFNFLNPFPEELTRVLVFRLTDLAFCPGPWAARNMADYSATTVDTEQNTLLDALRVALDAGKAGEGRESGHDRPERYCVVSIHRFENIFFRRRLAWIIAAVERAAAQTDVIFVLHPATIRRLETTGFLDELERNPRVHFRQRMSYMRFIRLLRGAEFVMTDGGSNQEELYYLQKPTLVMRKATERTEGLDERAVLCRFREDVLERFLRDFSYGGPSAGLVDSSIYPSRRIVESLELESARAVA